jgi:hypothetical protein
LTHSVALALISQADIQEGCLVDLHPDSSIPCVVSFAPGQERRVHFAGLWALCAVWAGTQASTKGSPVRAQQPTVAGDCHCHCQSPAMARHIRQAGY